MNDEASAPAGRRFGGDAALATALKPRAEREGRLVALVFEGGGMRASFAAGAATGLAEAGLPFDAFDMYLGSSAGALNILYWISRIPRVGTRVYVDDLTSPKDPAFFRFRGLSELMTRLLRAQPVMNLHAVEHALTVLRPVDREAVAKCLAPVLFPITRADDLVTAFRDARELPSGDLLPTLLAAASVPVLADVYDLAHGRYIDGACGAPLPVAEAIARGCTDLVVLLNLPPPLGPAWYETFVLYALAGRRGLTSRVARAVRAGRAARRDALELIETPPPGVNITVLAPSGRLVRSLELDPLRVERCVDDGIARGRAAVERARLFASTSGAPSAR